MSAFSNASSFQLTKQTALTIALGGLFAISPLFANFAGNAAATMAAVALGVLAIAAAATEAAGTSRFRNHGWTLAALAAVVLITPWALALTGVGQVLGTFSLAAMALLAAAAWRLTSTSENALSEGEITETTAEPAATTSTVTPNSRAGRETIEPTYTPERQPKPVAAAVDRSDKDSNQEPRQEGKEQHKEAARQQA